MMNDKSFRRALLSANGNERWRWLFRGGRIRNDRTSIESSLRREERRRRWRAKTRRRKRSSSSCFVRLAIVDQSTPSISRRVVLSCTHVKIVQSFSSVMMTFPQDDRPNDIGSWTVETVEKESQRVRSVTTIGCCCCCCCCCLCSY